MTKFICPIHGKFKPKVVNYSCPLTAFCPKCERLVKDSSPDAGIKILTEEESRKKRPWLYEKNDKKEK